MVWDEFNNLSHTSCSRCRELKVVTSFCKYKGSPIGLNNICRDCSKLDWKQHRARNKTYRDAYWLKNKESLRQKQSIYLKNNRHVGNAANQRYAAKNREMLRIKSMLNYRKAYLANPEKFKHKAKAQRAFRRHGITVRDLKLQQWRDILTHFENRCCYCMKEIETENVIATQDHLLPISRGGMHTASNIVPACINCNSQKQRRTYDEFMEFLPPLTSNLPKPITINSSGIAVLSL